MRRQLIGHSVQIEPLESRQLFSVAPGTAAEPIVPAISPALVVHLNKAFKGTVDLDGTNYPLSIIVKAYSTKTKHVDVTVYVINNKGKLESLSSVGKLSGRRIDWTLAGSIKLISTFSTNGKEITGTVIDGSKTGSFILKLT